MEDNKTNEKRENMSSSKKAGPASGHKRKSRRRRRQQLKRILVAALIVIAVIIIAVVVIQRRTYHKYSVQSSAKNEDVQSAGYVQLGDCVLKYASDGASLLDQKQETVWKQSYEMTNPVADVRDETAVVADKEGTLMYIFKKEAPVGAVETSMPILKARVAKSGVVAAILQDGEKTWIDFYATDGSLIAENQTRIDSPGYPVDLAVSPDGKLIMIAYLYVEDGQTTSYVAFYNFGDEGQGEIDNIVAGFTYEGVVVPQVVYLDGNVSAAFRDDGFSIYEGSSVPKEKTKKEIKTDIVSTFYNEKYVGLVFKSGGKEEKYTMTVYDLSGKEKFSRSFNMEYKNIRISDDMIIMNNDSQVSMYSMSGIEKFNGNMDEGVIKDIFKMGSNRYILVSENGIKTIKLK
ncbi:MULTISPECIES: DUF5711 family protein [Blautia]|uniref:DUF5711 family protein n=1 Tax=Blautia TaxID=572511 RepID=UPI001FAB289E|nr:MULTISPECIES: DUF5711 family protein [Blautia]